MVTSWTARIWIIGTTLPRRPIPACPPDPAGVSNAAGAPCTAGGAGINSDNPTTIAAATKSTSHPLRFILLSPYQTFSACPQLRDSCGPLRMRRVDDRRGLQHLEHHPIVILEQHH